MEESDHITPPSIVYQHINERATRRILLKDIKDEIFKFNYDTNLIWRKD